MTRRTRIDGSMVFRSETLEETWGLGLVDVQTFSPAAAQYVTNYVRKRAGLERPEDHGLAPEFQVMSRRPGIGAGFVDKFLRDIYPDGFVTRPGGARRRPPRFYDLRCESRWPATFRQVKRRRAEVAATSSEHTGQRLLVREAVEEGRLRFYDSAKGRPFEKGIK